ncbi:MAG TPA: ABC transporter ATP-binding protein [Candidatus Limnocylindria bacterium]|nr:ABC transporter ATP-binding protein [Candidatus Limnocylindria bacterium]
MTAASPTFADRPAVQAPVIRALGLTKRYGDKIAVDRLDLEVRRGEVFGLLGPNGAGKTTTILMLLGLSEPSEGRAQVVGFDPTRDPLAVKRVVGYLPDNVGFYGDLTGRENLRFTCRLNGLPDAEADSRIAAVLEQVGLVGAADDAVETYSRGMRQRLGLADVLVKDPDVVILDEPTIAIDPEGVAELLALIRRLATERGMAVLLSSHLLHQVQQICDRVAIFVEGRVVALGSPAQLAERLATGSSLVEVGADGDPEHVRTVLEVLPGVRRVERDASDARLWLVSGVGDVRRSVAEAAGRGELMVWHLRRRGDELDEVYRRYFAEAEGRAAERARERDDGAG